MATEISENTVAIVTGGASGIGAAIVTGLRERAASVVFGDVNDSEGEAVAAETGATYLPTDVRSPEAHEQLVGEAVDRFGGLDHAFYNAGVLGLPIEQHFDGSPFDPASGEGEMYRRMMAVNVDGVVFGVAAALPAMRARGGGGIVATASVAGLLPYSPDPWYAASKHAVVGYVRSVAHCIRDEGITVNAICPGGVATPMTGFGDDINPDVMLPPSVVAEAQLDAAMSDQTGQCLTVVARHGVHRHEFTVVEGF